jgi:hypothetical protein
MLATIRTSFDVSAASMPSRICLAQPTKTTDSTGYKYICTFHGGFMNAYVVVQ